LDLWPRFVAYFAVGFSLLNHQLIDVILNFIQKGLVIPISLVSKSPSVLPNTVCKLLVANPSSSTKLGADRLLSTQTNKSVNLANMPADLASEDSSAGSGKLNFKMYILFTLSSCFLSFGY
jgi:hypothetical protein